MTKEEKEKLSSNLLQFIATYLIIARPKMPSYDDSEEAWTQFLERPIKAFVDKQEKVLEDLKLQQIKYVPPEGGAGMFYCPYIPVMSSLAPKLGHPINPTVGDISINQFTFAAEIWDGVVWQPLESNLGQALKFTVMTSSNLPVENKKTSWYDRIMKFLKWVK